MIKPDFRSLKWQIQAWHTLLLTLVVGGLLTAFYFYEKEVKVQLLDKELQAPVHALLPFFVVVENPNQRFEFGGGRPAGPRDGGRGPRGGGMGPPDGGRGPRDGGMGPRDRGPRDGGREPRERGERGMEDRPSAQGEKGSDSARPGRGGLRGAQTREQAVGGMGERGFYVVFIKDGEITFRSDNAPKKIEPPEDEDFKGALYRWNEGNREMLQDTPSGYLLLGISAERIDAEMNEFRMKIIIIGLSVIVLGLIVGSLMSARTLAPIKNMSATAQSIALGDLSRRIDTRGTVTELEELAKVLNDSFEKLQYSFDQQVRFTADASHEMRTPLAVILTKAELALAKERTPEKYRDVIQSCFESATHMRGLIESLLELSKIDSGEFQVFPEEGDFGSCVARSVALLEPLATQKEQTLHHEPSSITGVYDEARLNQVLINLISNAIKYTPENGTIDVRAWKDSEGLHFSVADNGHGIDPDKLPHIFDRFYQTDEARSDEGSTGLGLAITKAIVEAHRGTISAESTPGAGSTFTVTLPNGV